MSLLENIYKARCGEETVKFKITQEMIILSGTTTKKERCYTKYIVFLSENNVFIAGTSNNWDRMDGSIYVYPNYIYRLAENLDEFYKVSINEIEAGAYNAYMNGAH